MKKLRLVLPSALTLIFGLSAAPASAACTVPNTLSNGQVADATEVMDNFEAVAVCADDAADLADTKVAPSGSPGTGEIAVFSGATSVTGGDLSGDVSTSGSTTTTLASSGVTPGTYANANVTVDAKGRITAASSGSVGSGGSFHGALVKKSANQTSANYTSVAAIAWNDETYDHLAIHDNSTNNTRLTVPSGVNYVRIAGYVTLDQVSANVLILGQIRKNGGGFDGISEYSGTNNTTLPRFELHSAVVPVTAGDYFEFYLQVADSSITVVAGESWFAFEVVE